MLDNLTNMLGILGAYFAILLVLAVSVETLLEPITWFKGLRKQVSPDDALKDIKGWLPDKSDAAMKAAAIANLSREYNVKTKMLEDRVTAITSIADDTAKKLGITKTLNTIDQKLAIQMSALRYQYDMNERTRVTILRIVSAFIGILIAIWLQVDTFKLLAAIFPPNIQLMLASSQAQYGGMIITGLAASAGSSFWHDQLGRLRAIKDSARQLEDLSKKDE